MILLRLLDHDLHRARKSVDAVPLWIETPAKPGFVPAIVSLSTPKFGVSRKLKGGRLRSGVFAYDSDRLDEVITDLMRSALDLSKSEDFPNRFDGPAEAFAYVQKQSGTTSQPHALLVPDSWTDEQLLKWGGPEMSKSAEADGRDKYSSSFVYGKVCRVIRYKVDAPVFFSRPDFVGMYTQFVGGHSSIVLHNVRNGLAFCHPTKKNVRRRTA